MNQRVGLLNSRTFPEFCHKAAMGGSRGFLLTSISRETVTDVISSRMARFMVRSGVCAAENMPIF